MTVPASIQSSVPVTNNSWVTAHYHLWKLRKHYTSQPGDDLTIICRKFILIWHTEIADENMVIVSAKYLGWSNAYSINWSATVTVIKSSTRIQHLDSSGTMRSVREHWPFSTFRNWCMTHITKLYCITLKNTLVSLITSQNMQEKKRKQWREGWRENEGEREEGKEEK